MRLFALRRLGFRFIALADDICYPVTFTDLRLAKEQNNLARLEELTAIRAERFHLMEGCQAAERHGVLYPDDEWRRARTSCFWMR